MERDMSNSYERVVLSFEPMRETMWKRNITDSKLADKVGVKVDVIRNMFKYQDTVTLSLIRSICEVLDCGPSDLITAGKIIVIPPAGDHKKTGLPDETEI